MVLSDIKAGKSAVIKGINTDFIVKTRLLELGLKNGVKVTVERIGLFKSPIQIGLRGFSLAIRRELAQKIEVGYE